MRYRRATIAGGTYFFTVNLEDRQQTLLVGHINELREALREVKTVHPFNIDAMVILPDHMHALWTLPPGDTDYAKRWMLIKAGFSRLLPKAEQISASRQAKGERGIWQRRYWEHLIRDDRDFERHVDYIHYNPVKHGHVERAADWPWSSFHRYVRNGILPVDWGDSSDDSSSPTYGERD
ncbi:MAG: transposase [Rhodocyclaceae bacterium]|nr:transposase [Rhodocyclaceae bacterium]MBX3667515.1 transposase [Rhodocyclaceae bacterium]